MKRIVIVGCGGAGKSTLARELGVVTGLPVIHLDAEYWRPGWTAPPSEVWSARVDELLARERWILDGNYSGTMERRFAAADTIVLLAPATIVCVWRVVRRRLVAGRRPDLATGCEEHIGLEFLRWIVKYRRKQLPEVLRRIDLHRATKRIEILRGDGEVRDFVARVRRECESPYQTG